MSRTTAKKLFGLADHATATAGVECRKGADVVDETPGAYKAVDDAGFGARLAWSRSAIR
jgi:tRNA-splicing ligase RtcB